MTRHFTLLFLFYSLSLSLHAETVKALLYPQNMVPLGQPVVVSFGYPLPNGHLTDPKGIRILDHNQTEIPAHVTPLLPWRNLAQGKDLPFIRAVRIQLKVTFTKHEQTPIFIDTSRDRKKNLEDQGPPRKHWVMVNDPEYPGLYGVTEPSVYVTLPPAWMGKCAIKYTTVPFDSFREFSWNDNLITNNNWRWHDGQNFLKTLTNDIEALKPESRIAYLNAGEYEPWLFDRAMTLYLIYIRSGNWKALRSAHRAAAFYASKLDSRGFFTLKAQPDIKYSYGESLITDFIFTGDATLLQSINNVVKAGSLFDPVYQPQKKHGIWTETHLAFAWLTYITGYEATGNTHYAAKARYYADTLFYHQNHPPVHPVHGQAPNDGGLMHGIDHHEGSYSGEGPYWIFSPRMTALVVDTMQRYYLHSQDKRVIPSAIRFGDAILNTASTTQLIQGKQVLIPSYLASSQGNLTDTGPWSDQQHALNVAKVTAYAYHCSHLLGTPHEKYHLETMRLLHTADGVLRSTLQPEARQQGEPIYPLNPPRKGNWWFRTTLDLDYLIADQLTPAKKS